MFLAISQPVSRRLPMARSCGAQCCRWRCLGLALLWRRDRLLAARPTDCVSGANICEWRIWHHLASEQLVWLSAADRMHTQCSLSGWHCCSNGPQPTPTGGYWRWSLVALIMWNFGLIANWTVLHMSSCAKGMPWPALWRWQFEVPYRLVGTVERSAVPPLHTDEKQLLGRTLLARMARSWYDTKQWAASSMAEHIAHNDRVLGSTPGRPTIFPACFGMIQ